MVDPLIKDMIAGYDQHWEYRRGINLIFRSAFTTQTFMELIMIKKKIKDENRLF